MPDCIQAAIPFWHSGSPMELTAMTKGALYPRIRRPRGHRAPATGRNRAGNGRDNPAGENAATAGFTLSALQQVCSNSGAWARRRFLDIAQRLYESHKATTYPRTDCGYLPLDAR